ncbi:MAG: Cys-tRNA(Pro) deacylase [Saccharofermentanales bacterium]
MAKDRIEKTNALRILDQNNIHYELDTYEAPDGFLDGLSVARAVGKDPDEVFKTLVLQGASKQYYVCIIPVACELDLKKAARHFDEKRLDMIPVKDITLITGYIKGGCSPVGMKKLFRTAIAEEAILLENFTVSAGKVGLQMTLAVNDLAAITKAQFADVT